MRGLQVKCPTCCIVRHVTTEHYQPDQTPKGNFIELIDPWKTWRWNCYDDEGEGISTTPAVMMCCPGCSAPLVLNGRLTVLSEPIYESATYGYNVDWGDEAKPEGYEEPAHPEFICDICNKSCKSLAGLKAHKRSHKEKGNA